MTIFIVILYLLTSIFMVIFFRDKAKDEIAKAHAIGKKASFTRNWYSKDKCPLWFLSICTFLFWLPLIIVKKLTRKEASDHPFPKNEKGGWIIPDGTQIPDGMQIPRFSIIGHHVTVGAGCKIGGRSTVGHFFEAGTFSKIGVGVTIGGFSLLDPTCTIGQHVTIGEPRRQDFLTTFRSVRGRNHAD